MSDDRPVLLFGETYHHPNILYRTGFLVPDPVVVVDRGGDDTVLWASALEEGRARKESSVGEVRSTVELDIPPRARRRQRVRRVGRPGDRRLPRARAQRRRRRRRLSHRARRPSPPQRRRRPAAQRHLPAAAPDQDRPGGGVDHRHRERRHGRAPEGDRRHRRCRDPRRAAGPRGSQPLQRGPHLRRREPPARERLQHRGLDLLRRPRVRPIRTGR